MQVESPSDIVLAYANQAVWLQRRLEILKKEGLESSPVYTQVVGELAWCQKARDRMKETIKEPKGYLVLVLRSKVSGLQGRVGKVTYVNHTHNFASVVFGDDPKPRNLGMGNLQIIDLPTPSSKIPAAGMRVRFKDDSEEYRSFSWSPDWVYVEPMTSVNSGDTEYMRSSRRECKDRSKIATINGVTPL